MYTVLIVEDTLAVREEIYDILLMEGYDVLQAENGNSGFEIALKATRSNYFRYTNAEP